MEFRLVPMLLTVACSSCHAGTTAAQATDLAITDHYQLTLTGEKGKCRLKYKQHGESQVIELSPTAPCYFARRNGKPQSYAYKEVDVSHTFMVIGSPLSKEKRQKWNLSDDLVCGAVAQGVLIKGSRIEMSEKILEGGVFCRDQGADEKNFWFLAH